MSTSDGLENLSLVVAKPRQKRFTNRGESIDFSILAICLHDQCAVDA